MLDLSRKSIVRSLYPALQSLDDDLTYGASLYCVGGSGEVLPPIQLPFRHLEIDRLDDTAGVALEAPRTTGKRLHEHLMRVIKRPQHSQATPRTITSDDPFDG